MHVQQDRQPAASCSQILLLNTFSSSLVSSSFTLKSCKGSTLKIFCVCSFCSLIAFAEAASASASTPPSTSFAVSSSPLAVTACQQSSSPASQVCTSVSGALASMPKAWQKQVSSGALQPKPMSTHCSRLVL